MKTLLFGLALAGAGVSTANAQIFVPQSVANGAILGGIAGAFIGGHNNDRWGEGAVIGAAVGALIGAGAEQGRAVEQPRYNGYPVYEPAPIGPAPVVPAAPVYGQPTYGYPQYESPKVVYVERPAAPQVIYVERPSYPRVIYVQRPVRVYYPPVRYSPPPRWHGGRRR